MVQDAPCLTGLSNYQPSNYPCNDLYEWIDGDLYYNDRSCLGNSKTLIAEGGRNANGGKFNSDSTYYLWTGEMNVPEPDYINGNVLNVKLFYKGQEIYNGEYNNSDYSTLTNRYAFIKTSGMGGSASTYKVFYDGQEVAHKLFNSHMPNSNACYITATCGSSLFIDGTEYQYDSYEQTYGSLYYATDAGTGNNKVRTLYFNGQQPGLFAGRTDKHRVLRTNSAIQSD